MILCFFAISYFAKGQKYAFEHLGIESGLSQVSVNCCYQDELGMMWFGTRDGLNRYDGNQVNIFKPIPGDTTSISKVDIKSILGDGNGHLYIQTQGAVVQFDMKKEVFRNLLNIGNGALGKGKNGIWIGVRNHLYFYYQEDKKLKLVKTFEDISFNCILESEENVCLLGTNKGLIIIRNNNIQQTLFNESQIRAIHQDKKGTLWLGSDNKGLIKLSKNGNVEYFRHDPANKKTIASNYVRSICEDNLGYFWIATQFGLCRLDSSTGEFETYTHSLESNNSLTSSSITDLFKDKQGNIWIGTFFGGVNYFNPKRQNFHFYPPEKNGLPYPVIGNFIEDKNGLIWICTEGGGYITSFNRQSNTFTNYKIPGSNFKSIYYDKNRHCLWLGTHLSYLIKFDIESKNIKTYESNPNQMSHYFGQHILSIVPFENKLLLGSTAGVTLFDPETGGSTPFFPELRSLVTSMIIDAHNRLWVGTENEGLLCYDIKTGKTTSFKYNKNNRNGLSSNNINCIIEDDKQQVWIGTNGYGLNLYLPETNEFKAFTKENNNLIDNTIVALSQTKSGKILIGTGVGLSICDMFDNYMISNYRFDKNFPLLMVNDRSLFVSKEGDIYVGGINGMVVLKEEDLYFVKKPFDLQFSKLYVNNTEVTCGDKTGILKEALPYVQEIKIKPGYSVFSVLFSADNYIYSEENEVEYRLEGYESEWLNPHSGKMLSYTNLNPGKYELQLRLKSFPEITKALSIEIIPPFYNTWYAYIVYFLLFGGLLYWIVRQDKMRFYLKKSLEFEKREKERTNELTQSKLRFFTNISHEIRTPVTLIMGQSENLLHSRNIHPSVYNKIISINKNAVNLSSLINELMDFSKQEQGYLNLKISELNIIDFLNEIYLTFKEYAQNRNISFEFNHNSDKINLWIDMEQMQKVINNLLSNAFKFTLENGEISISATENEQHVIISVSDTGKGISSDDIGSVFDRFYQAEESDEMPGTGIGLALAKGIVELHSGTIEVESEVNKGSTFRVILKKGDTHFPEDVIRINPEEPKVIDYENSISESDFVDAEQIHDEKDKLLIVEDNDELRSFLKETFNPIYEVEVAADGLDGLEKVRTFFPDIVISDIMMSRMSGIELCSKIKNNFDTCHIPVILLTAKTALEHKFEGLRIGADDYVSKPFNVKLLVLRCNNLVISRKMMQAKYARQIDLSSQQQVATTEIDRKFIEKATSIVKESLDKNDFDVNEFAAQVGLSRSSLFNKLKGVTGLTPNNFISNIRLKKAAELLLNNPELNISDIAYTLNFSSPRYFNKCFKDLFGYAPIEYRKKNLDDFIK